MPSNSVQRFTTVYKALEIWNKTGVMRPARYTKKQFSTVSSMGSGASEARLDPGFTVSENWFTVAGQVLAPT